MKVRAIVDEDDERRRLLLPGDACERLTDRETSWKRAIRDERYMQNTYREVLKQPRPEDIGRDFGEDAPLLLVLLTRRIVVFLTGALAAADTRVTRVTCNQTKFDHINLLLKITEKNYI